MPRTLVISTGGTILARYDSARQAFHPVPDEAPLRAAAHTALPGMELEFLEFSCIDSAEMDFPRLHALAELTAVSARRADLAGIIVLHGTDTLEEVAFLIDLFHDCTLPLVFVGAQLAPDQPGSDAMRNFIDALRLVDSGQLSGVGCLVCFNGVAHAARSVSKTDTTALESFCSAPGGEIARIDFGGVVLLSRRASRATLALVPIVRTVRLFWLTLGDDGATIRGSARSGCDGVVIAGFGAGNAPPPVVAEVASLLRERMPVVVASRCQTGRALPFTPGGRALANAGAMFAGVLSPLKARLLLAVLLSSGLSGGKLRAAFEAFAQPALGDQPP